MARPKTKPQGAQVPLTQLKKLEEENFLLRLGMETFQRRAEEAVTVSRRAQGVMAALMLATDMDSVLIPIDVIRDVEAGAVQGVELTTEADGSIVLTLLRSEEDEDDVSGEE